MKPSRMACSALAIQAPVGRHTVYHSVRLAQNTNYECNENEMTLKRRKTGVFGNHTGLTHSQIQS